MALTQSRIEQVIESRLGGFVAQVREITGDPSRPSILESASWAMRKLGYTVASVTDVTDAEAGEVRDADIDVFLDLTELKTLKSLPGNLPAVDVTVGPQAIKMSGLLKALEDMIARRTSEVQAEHGWRIPGVLSGTRRKARIIYP